MKTFSIFTFGCRTNQAESRMIGEQLCRLGWQNQLNREYQSDLMIINSCAVTSKAEKEVRQLIRKIKRENPNCFLVVTGCWAEIAQNAKLKAQNQNLKLKTLKNINLLAGNKDKEKIGEMITKSKENNGYKSYNIYTDKYFQSRKVLVKIQDGCDNYCSYCLVPYLRGRSVSRPPHKIVDEIKQLTEKGINEVILTGIDLGSYKLKITERKAKQDNNNLVKLLLLILKETNIKKISFGSINLEVFTKDFIALYQGRWGNRLSPHFHIPLQSGCNETLQRMKRKYKIFNFQFSIFNLLNKIPGFSFSTDIIVGFPGETEKEFNKTLKFLRFLKKKMGKKFTKIHIFRYSRRPGTLAFKMEGKKGWEKVPEVIKNQRAKRIKILLTDS
jgi:threonylcarbamoyladenosine tRNA methylthiotransferase MtaB